MVGSWALRRGLIFCLVVAVTLFVGLRMIDTMSAQVPTQRGASPEPGLPAEPGLPDTRVRLAELSAAKQQAQAAARQTKLAQEQLVRQRGQLQLLLEDFARLAQQNATQDRNTLATPPPAPPAPPATLPAPADESLAELQTELQQLRSERVRLLEQLLPAHPRVVQLDEQIERLGSLLLERAAHQSPAVAAAPPSATAAPAATPLPSAIAPPPTHPQSVVRQRLMDEMRAAQSATLTASEAVAQATAAVAAASEQERAAWQRFAQLADTLTIAGAANPTEPTSPTQATELAKAAKLADRRAIWRSALLLLALLLGLNAALLVPRPRDTFETVEQIEQSLGLPVLGVFDGPEFKLRKKAD